MRTKKEIMEETSMYRLTDRCIIELLIDIRDLVGKTESEEVEEFKGVPVDDVVLPPCCEHAMHGALGKSPPELTFGCGVCGRLWEVDPGKRGRDERRWKMTTDGARIILIKGPTNRRGE